MGRRFTGAEREQIEKLVSEGLTSREIAERLGRTEAAIRNIRYRKKLKTSAKEQLPTLARELDRLSKEIAQLSQRRTYLSSEISGLQTRRDQISKAMQQDELNLNARLQTSLMGIKQQKPELFYITGRARLRSNSSYSNRIRNPT